MQNSKIVFSAHNRVFQLNSLPSKGARICQSSCKKIRRKNVWLIASDFIFCRLNTLNALNTSSTLPNAEYRKLPLSIPTKKELRANKTMWKSSAKKTSQQNEKNGHIMLINAYAHLLVQPLHMFRFFSIFFGVSKLTYLEMKSFHFSVLVRGD